MTKKQLIKEIQDIISNTGAISMAEMESDCSPVHNSISDYHFVLIEGINIDEVTVTEYLHDNEITSYEIPITAISKWNLCSILSELNEYKERQVEAFCD